EAANVREVGVLPRDLGAARPERGVVVRDDQLAVAREVDVHLEDVDADRDRALERGHRVLRPFGRGTTVRVEPLRVHYFSSSSSSAAAGIGGGRGSLTCTTSAVYLMSLSASG